MQIHEILSKVGAEQCLNLLKACEKHWLCRRSIDEGMRKRFLSSYGKAEKTSLAQAGTAKAWVQAFEHGEKLCQSLRQHRWVRLFKDPVLFESIDRLRRELKLESDRKKEKGLEAESVKPALEITRRYFDESWYITLYHDVTMAKVDAFTHFCERGWQELRNPHAYFNTKYYLDQNPDVQRAKVNPFEHFVTVGWREGRSPSPCIRLAELKKTIPLLLHVPECPSLNWLHEQSAKSVVRAAPTPKIANTMRPSLWPFAQGRTLPKAPQPFAQLIAFYEQSIEASSQNSKHWGKIVQRKSFAKIHAQPRVPALLGYYDQRVPETLEAQIKLAKSYYIGAFAFRVSAVENWSAAASPLNFMVQNKTRFDFPFLISLQVPVPVEKDTVMVASTWCKKIEELLPLLQDERYLKYEGRPVIVLDGAEFIPELPDVMLHWREISRQNGIGEIFLLWTELSSQQNLGESHLDAAIQSPQRIAPKKKLNSEIQWDEAAGQLSIYDYSEMVKNARNSPKLYPRFETVLPHWDESGSKEPMASLYLRSHPQIYSNWLFQSAVDAYLEPFNKPNWVFVNAWNDWSHAAHLEPDTTFGDAYLEATRNALLAANQCVDTQLKPVTITASKLVIVMHVTDVQGLQDAFQELDSHDSELPEPPLWVITTPVERYSDTLLATQAVKSSTVVIPVKSLGGETRAFILALHYLKKLNAQYLLRITLGEPSIDSAASAERKDQLKALLGLPSVIEQFEQNPKLGLLGSRYVLAEKDLKRDAEIRPEFQRVYNKLTCRVHQSEGHDLREAGFSLGMFWARREAFDSLNTIVSLAEFENLQEAQALSWGIERLWSSVVMHQGYEVKSQ